jgi:LmbE family N-acetylglucosaminyl deacetylase
MSKIHGLSKIVMGTVFVSTFLLACENTNDPSFSADDAPLAQKSSAVGGKSIIYFSPHADDALLTGGGAIRRAVLNGDTVRVVLARADANEYAGLVPSMAALGVPESNVIFMGYGLEWDPLYTATDPNRVSFSGCSTEGSTGHGGLGNMSWHKYRTGVEASCTQANVKGDIQALMTTYMPDEVYSTTALDDNLDHSALGRFVIDAIVALKQSDTALNTKFYGTMGHYGATDSWLEHTPYGSAPFCDQKLPLSFNMPANWDATKPAAWANRIVTPIPSEMQPTAKCDIITADVCCRTPNGWRRWGRKDEIFWLTNFGLNMATTATVTTSSVATGSSGARAVDGMIDSAKEWVSNNQTAGAWTQLTWSTSRKIGQVNLFDRNDTSQNVLTGTLSFSDGSSISVGELPTTGAMKAVTFATKTVTWVKFTVNTAQGTATGLAEIQALGQMGSTSNNLDPQVITGVSMSSPTIVAGQTSTASLVAHDLDGNTLTTTWSAEAGSITSAGVFTAPSSVSAPTYYHITAQVSDGLGGVTNSYGTVLVTPR